MVNPVFYIAESPNFSSRAITIALLILVAILAAFVAFVIIGIRGFHRLGRGRRDSFSAKVAPVVGGLDVLLFMATVREAPVFAIAPLAAHAAAFWVGRNTRRRDEEATPNES